MEEHFGFATSNWKSKLNKFIEKNKNPKLWQLGTQERMEVIGRTLEFMREAEKLVADHPDLKKTIISESTNGKLYQILPERLIEWIQVKSSSAQREDKDE